MTDIYQFKAELLEGGIKSLADFQGQVMLIVNTASRCGFTRQFSGLEALYQKYKDQGFVVLGFPCNQFGQQDPGSNKEITSFCQRNYGVTFPMFAKIEVNGADAHEIFHYLMHHATGILGSERIKWNFTKFLVNQQGTVIDRFAPIKTPEGLEKAIEKALAKTS